jgi:putative ABC transport system substrate-binding protein
VYRIGFVSPTSPGPTEIAFRQGLRELGYVEGKNLVFEARFAEGRFERFPELIAEMIRAKVDVIMVGSSPGVLAAKKATTSIPIVFAGVTDPIGTGIVTTLARPGGNVTGITIGFGESGIAGKWLEIIKDFVPKVKHIAVLTNALNPVTPRNLDVMRAAARNLQLSLEFVDVREVGQLEKVFGSLRVSNAQAIVVTNDPFFFNYRAKIVNLVAEMRLPAVYFTSEFVDAGGLLSYGPSVTDSYRRAARLVDKILKGAKPAELPVEQPVDFEMAVNLRTAKSMQLTIPQVVLVRANKIVE